MNTPEHDNLEKNVTALTQWDGPAPELWREALRVTEEPDAASPQRSRWLVAGRQLLTHRFSARFAAVLAIAAVGVIIAAVLVPEMGKARTAVRSIGSSALALKEGIDLSREPMAMPQEGYRQADTDGDSAEFRREISKAPAEAAGRYAAGEGQGRRVTRDEGKAFAPAAEVPPGSPPATLGTTITTTDSDRQVIRKATIELQTADVRGAFLRAANLISQARQEFVADSSLTGEGPTAHATVTLRVTATRLPEVMIGLRELGKVLTEKAEGEDVTDQIVDLEARLRNEQRVETELLDLLAKRTDAPLKEILDLRDKISEIRGHIEQMTAQRDRLGRLVSLATVLVVIRAEDQPPAKQSGLDTGLGAYFSKEFNIAWRDGVRVLADTVSWFIHVAIAGAIWWALLVFAIIAARRAWKRPVPAIA